jgi:hypothetical protein
MRRNTSRTLFGLVFIAAAALILGNMTGLWFIQDFRGWWTLFLIVPGIAGMIDHGVDTWNLALVLIGAWLLASSQDWIPWRFSSGIFWVVIFLIIGLELLLGGRGRIGRRRNYNDQNGGAGYVYPGTGVQSEDCEVFSHTALFGGLTVENHTQGFRGGDLTAIFGGLTLDLRNAAVQQGAVIDAVAAFGAVRIDAPENCRIVMNGTPILGGGSCQPHRPYDDAAAPQLFVRYTSVLGGVKVL